LWEREIFKEPELLYSRQKPPRSSLFGMSLVGKTALITGSTSGVGLAMAKAYAAQGANVLLNGFGSVDDALKQVRAVSKGGAKIEYHGADMSKVSDIESMMSQAKKNMKGVDVLINNAGIQYVSPVHTFPVEKWDAIIAINLSASFHTTRLALPHMLERNWGRVINVASTHGLVASAQKSAYVASKHGIVGMTKSIALETAKTGVTCNAICPGWVLTPLVQAQVDARAARDNVSNEEAKAALLAEKQPSGQFVTPEQLASLALFLTSDAASEVRGVAWNMDGGWTAQ
jgi:3-hydroxybutyrate dehydrogenase